MTLPAPAPEVSADTAPFWEATARGTLLLQRCTQDQTVIWYPRYVCPTCHSTELEWFEGSGRGTVYSCTVTTKGILEYKDAGSYVLALVELEEGAKMLTNVVDCDPASVHIGQAVEVVFHDTGAGNALPRFRPAQV